MKHLTRRDFLRLTGTATAGMALVACAPAAPTSSGEAGANAPDGEAVNIIWHCRTGNNETYYRAELEFFNEAQDQVEVTIEATPNAEYQQKLATLAAGGELGDCYWGNVFGQLYPFASAGIALDVTPLIEASDLAVDDFFDVGIQQISWDGKLIGIPLGGHPGWTTMYTNITVFEEADVPLPEWEWTYQDPWLDVVRAVSADTDGDGNTDRFGFQFDYVAQNAYTFIRSWGGDWVDPDDRTTATVTSDPTVEALAFMRDLVYEFDISPTQEETVDEMFLNELTASWSNGIWYYGTGRTAIGDKFEWQGFPMPSGPGGRGSFIGCDTVCINSNSQNIDAAFTWGRWLVTRDACLRRAQAGSPPPYLIEAWEDESLADDPTFQAMRQWLEVTEPWTVPANARALEFRNTFNQGIQSVLNQDNDFMTEVQNLQAAIQGVLDKPAI